MNPTGALLIILGLALVARSVIKDSNGQTLPERILGNSGSSGGTSGASSAPAAQVQGAVTPSMLSAIANKMGWNTSQVNAWSQVISMESGGNPNATNPGPGSAYGIGQFLGNVSGPGAIAANKAKYYAYGGNPNTVQGQLVGMANYIKQRYGTPAAALAHENSVHWY